MRKKIHEITFMRSFACLSILLMHITTMTMNVSGKTIVLETLQMSLMYGTPMFIFISEFLLSNAYPDKIPKGFWAKRLKFILVPYVFMGVFYAGIDTILRNGGTNFFLLESIKHIFFGYFHGYFILIIFQFYVLHVIYIKYISRKYSDKTILTVSITVNIFYLSVFNFIDLTEILSFLPKINTIVYLGLTE